MTANNFEVSDIMGHRNRDEPMVPEGDGPLVNRSCRRIIFFERGEEDGGRRGETGGNQDPNREIPRIQSFIDTA